MLRLVAAGLGVALVGMVLYDVARASLTARGGAPLIDWAARLTWRLVRLVERVSGRELRGLMGPVALIAGFLCWLTVLWAGWTLVFLGEETAILHGESRQPAALLDRVYFVGYSITTLGIGDFVAAGRLWRLLTILAAMSGFFVLTLSITFLVSLLSAVAHKRSVARTLAALGGTPAAYAEKHWLDDSCSGFVAFVPMLIEDLETLGQEYVAYPLLHYYHAPERESSLSIQLAALTEFLMLFRMGALECRTTAHGVRPLLTTVSGFLEILHRVYLQPAEQPPPAPPLDALPGELRVTGNDESSAALRGFERQRRLLGTLVRDGGWSWEDVHVDRRQQ